MDWNILRFQLFQALDSLKVQDIYLVERDNNILTVRFVVEDMGLIRPLVKMRLIDELIAKNSPELYSRYLFLYEVWDAKMWGQQLVSRFVEKRKGHK